MAKRRFIFWMVGMMVLVSGCVRQQPPGKNVQAGMQVIRPDNILRHVKVLASDEFEGRAPASRGEELTVEYLARQFKRLGLKPGNPDGTYVQQVPLMGFTTESRGSFSVGNKKISLKPDEDWVAVCRRFVPEGRVQNSELVFVGYGIVAPEFGWDDYKGVDVKGKTLVMLINDPPLPDPKDPARLDEKMFGGDAMTYYGRWSYKYEIAAEKGAAAALIVHETDPAGYPFSVVSGSWGRENFDINKPDKNLNRPVVEAWITLEVAQNLFQSAGWDYAGLKKKAAAREFKPVVLKGRADFEVKNQLREVESANAIAKLEGSDPKLKDEYVVYTAHWDHLGRNPLLKGDQILNGAQDNATGVAALLTIAEAFAQLPRMPMRSLLFLSVTAEEKGLLGAKYYVDHPLYPLARTAADINMDGMNPWGRTKDIVSVGLGQSDLDEVLIEAAREQGRIVKPDPEPGKGGFYRSDHFEFVRKGIPAVNAGAGVEFLDKPPGYGMEKRNEYTKNDYHKVTDEVKPDWDLSGLVEDAQLLFQVGWRVANNPKVPQWRPGAEFAKTRESGPTTPTGK